MSNYLLDTGILIRYLRGHRPTVKLLRELGKNTRLGISTMSRLEIFAGMHPDERQATTKFLSRLAHYDIDKQISEKAGELVYYGRTSNAKILIPDAIIASTAVIHRLTLVTLNTADFTNIPGLSLYPLT